MNRTNSKRSNKIARRLQHEDPDFFTYEIEELDLPANQASISVDTTYGMSSRNDVMETEHI